MQQYQPWNSREQNVLLFIQNENYHVWITGTCLHVIHNVPMLSNILDHITLLHARAPSLHISQHHQCYIYVYKIRARWLNIHCEHIPYITLLVASISLKIQINGRRGGGIRIHYCYYMWSPISLLLPPLYVCQEVSREGGEGGGGQSARGRAGLSKLTLTIM